MKLHNVMKLSVKMKLHNVMKLSVKMKLHNVMKMSLKMKLQYVMKMSLKMKLQNVMKLSVKMESHIIFMYWVFICVKVTKIHLKLRHILLEFIGYLYVFMLLKFT